MASSVYVMVLDHVLRKPGTNAVITEGRAMYESLTSTGRLALLCGEDYEMADWFLRTNGLVKHTHLIPEDKMISPSKEGRRMAQIRQLRGMQSHIAFVLEPDPEIALALYREGIPVFTYLHPQYTQPSFRPDYKSEATPWNDLIREVDYQTRMRAENAYDLEDIQ